MVSVCVVPVTLKTSAHACSSTGSVAEAIEILGSHRIGHGLRALEDPAVVELIAERDVHLELCPGRNRRLNLIESLADHPLRHYLDAGLSCSLSTDDPAVFGWGLTEELAREAAVFDLTHEDLLHMAREAVRHSFASEDQRQRVLQRITNASGPESPAVGASQAQLTRCCGSPAS